ncbi:MAG: S-adenosylmethionine decarboxylase proenzyme [Candidatus Daviesbacteria bacterium GW2011_GWB1_41_5]|uniref:S-adenosylmethionine decarboxylase proenzyme n=1 Tax=Candidatus Daviesbacteria bacterium GW2011_GWB1_41_5 TaxID=1618429 RepID=A0A0G0ZMI2_9BACT|nr:MAG: S-adenosylmethionine decarboxylase proenzyme [Candidatus Daviesbacteria bacterium GW2011_GWB1_41_5]
MTAQRYHILIDVAGVSKEVLSEREGLEKFLNDLPGIIGMHVLKGPVIAEGIPENPGLSGFVIIDYSHISIHTFTNSDEALVDIFSCKPYEQDVAKKAVLDYFRIDDAAARIQQVSWG